MQWTHPCISFVLIFHFFYPQNEQKWEEKCFSGAVSQVQDLSWLEIGIKIYEESFGLCHFIMVPKGSLNLLTGLLVRSVPRPLIFDRKVHVLAQNTPKPANLGVASIQDDECVFCFWSCLCFCFPFRVSKQNSKYRKGSYLNEAHFPVFNMGTCLNDYQSRKHSFLFHYFSLFCHRCGNRWMLF